MKFLRFVLIASWMLPVVCQGQSIQLAFELKGFAGDYTQHVSVACDGHFIGDVEFDRPVCAEIPRSSKVCTIERRGFEEFRINLDQSIDQQAFTIELKGWKWGVSTGKWNSQLWNQQMNVRSSPSLARDDSSRPLRFDWSGKPLEPGSVLTFRADSVQCTNMNAVQAKLEAAFLTRHHVVTRSDLDAVLNEHRLQMSGMTESMPQGGALVNADFLVQILCVQENSEYQLRFIRIDTGEIHSICSIAGDLTKGINPALIW